MSFFSTMLLDSFWILVLNELAASPFINLRAYESSGVRGYKLVLGCSIFVLALASAFSIPKIYIAPVVGVAISGWIIYTCRILARRVVFFWYSAMVAIAGAIFYIDSEFYSSNRSLVFLGITIASVVFYWLLFTLHHKDRLTGGA